MVFLTAPSRQSTQICFRKSVLLPKPAQLSTEPNLGYEEAFNTAELHEIGVLVYRITLRSLLWPELM